MNCASCGAENRPSSKFCRRCGTALARTCPSCGSPVAADSAFCDECGTRLDGAAAPPAAATPAAGATERRLVSVLFADLVGFTAASADRDAEDVRELLTRYFDTCRRTVDLYGGTIEKFIGDAVMAVWGAPIVTENDAERAVRAALDLVAAVEALGAEIGQPQLRARAAVLTGEAAVNLDAAGQGMVAGDLVNTASRVQALAEPGAVLVGDSTRRVTEAALAYEDAGEHLVKGKEEPIKVWRALRVMAGIQGQLKSEGLEPPFVGRDRELRLIKELFHASADETTAHLVSVVGMGGVGKSRLAWELYKYVDGLAQLVYWQRGRCLAYGEGVAYSALAEMVRMRCLIEEGEAADSALAKLRAVLEQNLADAEERAWVEPRVAHLLGLEERATWDRQDLFGAWRLLFERLSQRQPTVLVFEDMQWADTALVDFIEHLLEWSRAHRLYVVTLARPELLDRYPDWGAGKRNFTSLTLEPLSPEAMENLLSGFAPGLPDELSRQVLERAEGVPLYAVETIRMLLDRGALTRTEGRYVVNGPVGALEVPESLQGLIAARLDGLAADERRLVQQAAVLGKTFTTSAIAGLSGTTPEHLEPVLASLLRKEVLTIQADPRSPEHGQYGFLQELVRRVAYETLARRDRKALHLRVAGQLEAERGADDSDVAQVIAAHLLDARAAVPDADDAAEIQARAVEMLTRAGERAAALAAGDEAQRYFERAAELCLDAPARGRLLERAGEMAWARGKLDQAYALLNEAREIFEAANDPHSTARADSWIGMVEWRSGRMTDAIRRLEAAMEILAGDQPDPDVARVATTLGRLYVFLGDVEAGAPRVEQALELAERLDLPEQIVDALNNKAVLAMRRERLVEAVALLQEALRLSVQHGLTDQQIRTLVNLGETSTRRDDFAAAEEYQRAGLAYARKLGHSYMEGTMLSELVFTLTNRGRWDEALEMRREIPAGGAAAVQGWLPAVATILTARGAVADARALCGPVIAPHRDAADVQDRAIYESTEAILRHAEGNLEEAHELASRLFGGAGSGLRGWQSQLGFEQFVETSMALGHIDQAERTVSWALGLPRGLMTHWAAAAARRYRAALDAARRLDSAGAHFTAAEKEFREIGLPFPLACTLLEHAEYLADEQARPLLAESRTIFEDLKARPWLERLAQAEARSNSATVST